MAAGEYLTGLGLLTLAVGAALFAAIVLARRFLPHLAGVERALAVALLATAALIALHLVPAMFAVLNRWTVAALSAALVAAAAALVRGGRRRASADSPEPVAARGPEDGRAGIASTVIAALAVAAVAIYALAILVRLHAVPPTFIDTLTFHLPGVARWIQSGSIWQIDQFLPGQAQGYYPGNGNLVELAAVLPWESDFLARFVNLPFFAITGLAVYAAGRELGSPGPAAALTAAAAISYPAVTSYVSDSPTPDAVMYAGFATGVLFLLRHARTGERSDLLLGGLGLGIAFGSRWYGVSSVAVVVAVWLLAQLAAGRRDRRLAADAAVLAGIIALAGGVWLLRNWVEAGNPFFPVELTVLGQTLFEAPPDLVRELVGFSVADYLGDPEVLGDLIVPALEIQTGYVGAAFALGLLASAGAAIVRRGDAARGKVIALAVTALGLGLAYAVTPYTALGLEDRPYELGANVRYLVPALLVAAPVLAWGLARSGRARPLLELCLALLTLDAILGGVAVSVPNLVAATGVALAIALAAIAIDRARGAGPVATAATVGAVAAVIAAGLYLTEERLLEDRYRGASPALDTALAGTDPGARIGVAGAWPVTTISPILPLFGDRLENEVEYVGAMDDGFLRPYERRAAFVTALQGRGFDVLVVGHNKPLAYPQLPEHRWAQSAGWRRLAGDEHFTVLAAPADADAPAVGGS